MGTLTNLQTYGTFHSLRMKTPGWRNDTFERVHKTPGVGTPGAELDSPMISRSCRPAIGGVCASPERFVRDWLWQGWSREG